MRKKIDILFYIEHYDREIEVFNLIKEQLKDKNIVLSSTIFEMGISKIKYNPKLIITPWAYDNRDYFLICSFLFKEKIRILNLHHEQITNEDRIKALLPKELAKEGYHISWGEEFTKKLLNQGINKEKIFETGSIRLQQTKETKYDRKDLKSELGLKIDTEKKWTLFISSYSWKNLSKHNLKQIEKRGRKNVNEYKKIVEESYEKTLNWIEKRLDKDKNIEYIYRLHPSEMKDEKLKKLEEKYKNFYVIKELELKEWIKNSDEIELWISTGIAEVIILEKPFRIIRPIELKKNIEIDGFDIFDKITTEEEYLNNFNGKSNLEKGQNYIKNKYRLNLNPINETVKAIEKILEQEEEKIKINSIKKFKTIVIELIKDFIKIFCVKYNLKLFNKIGKISKETRFFYEKK